MTNLVTVDYCMVNRIPSYSIHAVADWHRKRLAKASSQKEANHHFDTAKKLDEIGDELRIKEYVMEKRKQTMKKEKPKRKRTVKTKTEPVALAA